MQTVTRNKQKWVLISVLILIVAVSSYYVGSGQKKEYPDYVSHSPAPSGVKAFYTYLGHEVDSVRRWSQPPNLLPKDEKQHLHIMVEPRITPTSEEIDQYIDFMNAGNTILLLHNNPRELFDMNIYFGEDDTFPQVIIDQDGRKYESELSSTVFLENEKNDEILLENKNGLVVALKRPYGDGQLIIANNPMWLTNEHILNADHLSLILSLLKEIEISSISINEYVHGEQEASIMKVYPKWFLLFVLQGALITILLLWHRGKRFGYILVPREETVRFSDERIQALASWYIKSEKYKDSLHIQAEYLKLVLQERWGIPYHHTWMESENRLQMKWVNQSEKEIHSFVRSLTKLLNEQRISKKDYLTWSKKINELRKEVEEG